MNTIRILMMAGLLFAVNILSAVNTAHAVDVSVQKDVVFATYGERALSLDLHLPDDPSTKRSAIILVHGGGWVQGNRSGFTPLAKALSKKGFVVANISYRLATETKFPGAVSDVKAATRWLRANAATYRVDPDRIVGIGGSAGGHLIAMAGLTPGRFEGDGGSNDTSSRLAAIVVMGSGVDQVARVRESKTGEIKNCTVFFGGKIDEVPEVYHMASPINHVSPQTPPILFLDGSLDSPGQRYIEMQKKLDELGIHNELQVIEGAKHGQWSKDPFRDLYVEAMTNFVTKVLPESEDEQAVSIEFLVGDYLVSEGGQWQSDQSDLSEPFGVDFDSRENMYVVELRSGRLLGRTPDGQWITLRDKHPAAYSGDGGPVSAAAFNGPHNVVVTQDDKVLISDSWNHCVREVDARTLKTTTIAGTGKAGFSGDGGDAIDATFNYTMCIALSPSGNTLHIADLKNRRIRNVDLQSGRVTTVAGNGEKGIPKDGSLAVDSPLVDPRAVASDGSGNTYILERNGNALRVIRADGTIHTVAGNGTKGFRDGNALSAQFGSPKHICCDPNGNVYIADDLNGAIRKFAPFSGEVTTILGRGFGDPKITLLHPHGVRWHDGSLYVVDTGNNRIMRMDFQ